MISASTIDQVYEAIASGERETILLGGELVYITHDLEQFDSFLEGEEEDLVQQPPRLASRGKLVSKVKSKLYLAASKEAVDALQGYKGKAGLLADQYLAYGLSQRSDTIVIGGGQALGGSLNLEVLVFTNQNLVDTFDRKVQIGVSGSLLDIALKDIFRTYPEHQVLWCAPLPDAPICDLSNRINFREVGTEPLNTLVQRKLFAKPQSIEESVGWIPGIAMSLLGMAIFAGAVGWKWSRVEVERAEYFKEISGYEEAYKNSSQSLELLRHRDFLLASPPDHKSRALKLDLMLRQVAQLDGVVIKSITFYDHNDPRANVTSQSGMSGNTVERDDFAVEILLPRMDETISARDQADPVLALLNNKTGMTVRVLDHVKEDIKINGSPRAFWHYRIGGNDQ